jgi:uncharacterized protein YegP (UPF0339 family)
MMHIDVYRSGLIFKDWRFRIVARNNRILASSEGYKNRLDCISAAMLIQTEAKHSVIKYPDKGARK